MHIVHGSGTNGFIFVEIRTKSVEINVIFSVPAMVAVAAAGLTAVAGSQRKSDVVVAAGNTRKHLPLEYQ